MASKRRATPRNIAVGNYLRANRGSAPPRELMRQANLALAGRAVRSNPGGLNPLLLIGGFGVGYWLWKQHRSGAARPF